MSYDDFGEWLTEYVNVIIEMRDTGEIVKRYDVMRADAWLYIDFYDRHPEFCKAHIENELPHAVSMRLLYGRPRLRSV